MEFKDSTTKENLARAFAGLCQDGARFQFISKSAESEGFEFLANKLKTFAKHKMAHAETIYKLMLDYTGEEKENVNIEAGFPFEKQMLKTSLADSGEIEENEGKNLYPHFARIAEDEGFGEIAQTFSLIGEVCLKHGQMLADLAEKFDSNSLYTSFQPKLWTCSNCGHNEMSKRAWETCPLCGMPQGYVIIEKD